MQLLIACSCRQPSKLHTWWLRFLLLVCCLALSQALSFQRCQYIGTGKDKTTETSATILLNDEERSTVLTFLTPSAHYLPRGRRTFLHDSFIVVGSFILSCSVKPANATDRRPLSVCLVAIQRTKYWAQLQAESLVTDFSRATNQQQQQVYLQIRLGAKALLTGKIGPGASGRIYTLASLQLPACLRDVDWYMQSAATSQIAAKPYIEKLRDGLASVVEFDGLETLMDPSPRSSLTLGQYQVEKAVYVRRVLLELVVPATDQLLMCFPETDRQLARSLVDQFYPSEIYTPLIPS